MQRVSLRYQPADAQTSAQRADALIAWLRDYTERRVNFRLADERRCLPPHVVTECGARGLFGIQVDEQYGGLALQPRDIARVQAQASAIDLSFGTFLLVSAFPGARPFQAFLNEPLRSDLLPRLAKGEILGAYAQTEAAAGSDFQGISTTARPIGQSQWRLSGEKMWIGNGSWAGAMTVLGHCERELSAYVVFADDKGVQMGPEQLTMGMRSMVQNLVEFRDVRLDEARVLGQQGGGLEVALDSMSWTRFALTASALGAMKRCLQLMGRFVERRKLASGLAADIPIIQTLVGESIARTLAVEAIVDQLAQRIADGLSVEVFALAKYVSSEFLWTTADTLVQVLGGRGYDEATGVPQLLRDARVYRIFEGASEALVDFIGQRALFGLFGPTFLETLGAPELAGQVKAALQRLKETSQRKRTKLAGDIVCWAVVVACLQQGRRPVLAWAEATLAQQIDAVDNPPPAAAVCFSKDELNENIEAICRSIGDVEQQLPGERLTLDPLLERS